MCSVTRRLREEWYAMSSVITKLIMGNLRVRKP